MQKLFMIWLLLGMGYLFAAVNINTATKEELCGLKGIGEVTAQRIIDYRKEHSFKRIDELMNVKGIGEKSFEKIKEDVTL